VSEEKKITAEKFKKAWAGYGGIEGAARDLGVSRMTIYRWCRKGEIPEVCKKYPHVWRNFHGLIREYGLNPHTLEPLK
jgi:DNA invertase Pin-like site-specific DNA recombinase